jgi:hypothetical protein
MTAGFLSMDVTSQGDGERIACDRWLINHKKSGVVADALVSWNFRHIVNLPRIHGYHDVNARLGYPTLEIRSPQEVLKNE